MLPWLFFATIFLLPAYVVRFSIFGVPTNIPEALAIVAIIASLIRKLRYPFARVTRNAYRAAFAALKSHWPEIIGAVLIFVGLGISTAVSPDPRAGLGVIKGWFLIPIAFAIGMNAKRKAQSAKEIMLNALAGSGIAVSLIALGYALPGQFTFDGRLHAFYDSPNQLGMWLAITVTATLWQIRNPKSEIRNLLLIGILPQAVVLLLTHSRGALLATAVGILAIVLLPKLQCLNKAALVKCSMLCVMCYVALSVLLTTQLVHFTPPDSRSSLASRVMIWRTAWDIGRDHWLAGIGPRQFQQEYLEYQPKYPAYLEWAAPEPHNLLLATWLNAGLLGLAGFLLLIARRSLHPLVIALLALGLFDTPVWAGDMSYVFWLTVIG